VRTRFTGNKARSPVVRDSALHLPGIVADGLVDAEFFSQDTGDVPRPVQDTNYLDAFRDGSVENDVFWETRDGK
jgi:hypothetical protein